MQRSTERGDQARDLRDEEGHSGLGSAPGAAEEVPGAAPLETWISDPEQLLKRQGGRRPYAKQAAVCCSKAASRLEACVEAAAPSLPACKVGTQGITHPL